MTIANGYCPNIVTQDMNTNPKYGRGEIKLNKKFDGKMRVCFEVILDGY